MSRGPARSGSWWPTRIRHRGGVLLFDTGFGFGNDDFDAYYRVQARGVPDALAEAGLAVDDVTSVVNCHLHADHAGQNGLFPGIPIYVQPAEWEIAHTTDHTILDWIDFPGADYRLVAGDHEPVSGIRVIATPGHTIGHQSLVVSTGEGEVVLAGQAVYTPGEWVGDPAAREGRSRAPDPEAYDRSIERLRCDRPDPCRIRARPPGMVPADDENRVSFLSRARRGTSGALYLQSATAGLNPLPRSPFSNAARRRDVEDRVPRIGEPRTVSGPEGSSTKRPSSSAAERPGPSRSSWWARVTSRSTEGARQLISLAPDRRRS